MSKFDEIKDLFSKPYLTIFGKIAGRDPLELPDRKNNFKYTRENKQKAGEDDMMHEKDINHITYYGAPTNIIDEDMYIAVGRHPSKTFTYTFYSDVPRPMGMQHIFTNPIDNYSYPPTIGKWWRRSINSTIEYGPHNMWQLTSQLIGKPFAQYKFPNVWYIFKPSKESEVGSLEEVGQSYTNIVDDDLWNRSSTVSSMISIESVDQPLDKIPSDIPIYDSKFNVYRYRHELTGYSVNDLGDVFLTEPSKLTHWFKGTLRELTYEIEDNFTEQNFKDRQVVFSQYLWPHSGTAYGSDENGSNFSLTEDVHNRWFIASSVFISESKNHAFAVEDFNEQTIDASYEVSSIMSFTQYIDDYRDVRFFSSLSAAALPVDMQILGEDYYLEEMDDSIVSGRFYKLFHINDFFNNSLIESSYVYAQYKWPHHFKAYGSNEYGTDEFSTHQIVTSLFWRSTLDVTDTNKYAQPTKEYFHDNRATWQKYIDKTTGTWYKETEDASPSNWTDYETEYSMWRGDWISLDYIYDDEDGAGNILYDIVWKRYRDIYNGRAYGTSDVGDGFSEEENPSIRFYRAKLEDIIDLSGLPSSNAEFYNKHHAYWEQYVASGTNVGYIYEGSDEIKQLSSDTAISAGEFWQIYYLNTDVDNQPYYVSGETVFWDNQMLSGWNWDKIKIRYTGTAYGSNISGDNFNETENIYELFWRTNINVLAPIDLVSSTQKFYNDYGAVWKQYISSGTNIGYLYEDSDVVQEKDDGTALSAGEFEQIYYLSANYDDHPYYVSGINILSSWNWNEIRKRYVGTAYGSDLSGADFNETEDVYHLFWRSSLNTITSTNLLSSDADFYNSYGSGWTQYIASGTNIGYLYENSNEIHQDDDGLALSAGTFEQIYYTSANISNPPYYVSGINVLSSWNWDAIRQRYELTRYASDNTGSNMMIESGTIEDIVTHWYRIDLNLIDLINMSNEDLLSKYSDRWQQYITSSEISVWKPEDDENDLSVTSINPENENYIEGVSSMIYYMPEWRNGELISSSVKWYSQVSIDPFAKLRIKYTDHSNSSYPQDSMFNAIPAVGSPAERPSVSNGVHNVILTETAPSSNIWVALAKDNPNLPSDEVLSSFEAIPSFMQLFTSHSDNEIPSISARFKPCRMVYNDDPREESPVKAFFPNVSKTNYATYSMFRWSDAYNNVIIGDEMISRETGIPERLLKTSSFNSFFSNSIYITGVSGANVGRDGKFVMNSYTGDYNTDGCHIENVNNVNNDQEIVIAETEYVNGRNPYDKFSYRDEYYSELTSLFNNIVFTCDIPNMYSGEKSVDEIFTPLSLLSGELSASLNLDNINIKNADTTYVIPAFSVIYRVVEGNSYISGDNASYSVDYAAADLDKLVYDNVGLHFNEFRRTVNHWNNARIQDDSTLNLMVYRHDITDSGSNTTYCKDFIVLNATTKNYVYHLSGIVDAPTKDTYHIFGAALECYMRSDKTSLTVNNITSPTSGYIDEGSRQIYRIYQINPNINSDEDYNGNIQHD